MAPIDATVPGLPTQFSVRVYTDDPLTFGPTPITVRLPAMPPAQTHARIHRTIPACACAHSHDAARTFQFQNHASTTSLSLLHVP